MSSGRIAARFVEWHLSGRAQPLAIRMNEGVCLAVEVDPHHIERRLETGYCDEMVSTLDEALAQTKNVVRGEGYWKQRETRATRPAHLTSPFHRVHTSLLGEGDVPGWDWPHREVLSLLVAARSSVRRHASTELAAHSSGTSTATSSLG